MPCSGPDHHEILAMQREENQKRFGIHLDDHDMAVNVACDALKCLRDIASEGSDVRISLSDSSMLWEGHHMELDALRQTDDREAKTREIATRLALALQKLTYFECELLGIHKR